MRLDIRPSFNRDLRRIRDRRCKTEVIQQD